MGYMALAVEADTGLAAVAGVVTQVMSWVGSTYEMVVSHPVMLIGAGFSVAFASAALLRKFTHG